MKLFQPILYIMRHKNLILITILFTVISSCSSKKNIGFAKSTSFIVANTIQIASPITQGGTDGKELPIEALLNKPTDAFLGKATLNENEVELRNFITLWDIDFKTKSIEFKNLINTENQPYPGFLRIIETETYDRYYITCNNDFNFSKIVSPKIKGLKVEIINHHKILITISEGYDNRQSGFTITFE